MDCILVRTVLVEPLIISSNYGNSIVLQWVAKWVTNIHLIFSCSLWSPAAVLKVTAFRQYMTDRSSVVLLLHFCTTPFIDINTKPLLYSPEANGDQSIFPLHNNHKHIIQVHQSCIGPCKDVYIYPLCSHVVHSTFSSSSLIIFSPMIYSVIWTSPYCSNNLSECTCISSFLAVPMFCKCSYGTIKAFVDFPLISLL